MSDEPQDPASARIQANALAELDLARCEQEPIHIPGAIQPHGALLAAFADTRVVTHASANLAEILGVSPSAALGRTLHETIGDAAHRLVGGIRPAEGVVLGQIDAPGGPDKPPLCLRAHRSGKHIVVDIEPIPPGSESPSPLIALQPFVDSFRHAATCEELCELAVRGLRSIAGYDRVMAYHFHDDGHGEVIAEDRAPDLEAFLGLHYPASDVPPQARRLFLRQQVGTVADSNYQPVPLLTDPANNDVTPLDLTHSALRSVSPIHCEYMRNMKTAASLTVGLSNDRIPARQQSFDRHVPVRNSGNFAAGTQDSRLWGMLVCHHATPRVASTTDRAVVVLIGQLVSLLLASLEAAEVRAKLQTRGATLESLIERFADPAPLPALFAAAEGMLLRMTNATGAMVRIDGEIFPLGRTPPRPAAETALASLWGVAGRELLADDELGLFHPELARHADVAAGALLLPLSRDTDDAILWFRPELHRTVVWGGDPTAHATSDPVAGRYSPRTSFAAWKETVRGRSAPWTEVDFTMADQLRLGLQAAAGQRRKAALDQLRYLEPLTGLPNRASLLQRLAESVRWQNETALLFLNLDRFREANDRLGHAAGDTLLAEVAGRLRNVAGPDQFAACLGTDEFVLLSQGLAPDAAAGLAEQIRRALDTPFEIAGRRCELTASVGIAFSGRSGDLDLLRAAEMAMHVAKRSGGNRAVVFELPVFAEAVRRFELDHELREALRAGNQFVLSWQVLFRLKSGAPSLAGFEAMMRWQHPRHGWISQPAFMPAADNPGLIVPLGEWVLTAASKQGHVLQQVRPDLRLIVTADVSAAQLERPGFCTSLVGVLEAEGLSPTRLCLKVTEQALANAVAASALAEVRGLGVRVTLASPGISYASLSDLHGVPVDMVCLDRGFLDRAAGGAEFLSALVAVAHAGGKQVIFAGIDSVEDFETASAAGADLMSGDFFAPALSAHAAEELIAGYRDFDDWRARSRES